MCDRNDLGVSVNAEADPAEAAARPRRRGVRTGAALEEPRIFIYDNYPGGIGFSAPLFDVQDRLLEASADLIAGCELRARLSVVRRADRRDRAAGQARRARPARAADRPRRRVPRRPRRRSTTARCRSECATLDRLRALVKGTGPGARPGARRRHGARRELTYEPVGDDGLPLIDAPMSASLAGATEIDGPLGKTLVVERHYAPADWHGSLQLRDARVTPDDVALIARDPAAADAPRARILYLDLETTGLSGGAGTVAFLVGCALSREDGSFLIRQFVLPSFAAERALIGAVSEWARAEAAVLVTYNGRTFDVPVMETRWAFHRLRSPWDELPHLDMLHVARRLWSKKHRVRRAPGRAARVGVRRAARDGERLPSRPARADAVRGRARRRRARLRDPRALLRLRAPRRLVGARAGAAPQPARSAVARRRHRARGAAAARRRHGLHARRGSGLLGRELHRRAEPSGGRGLLPPRPGRPRRRASAARRDAGRPGAAAAEPAPLRRGGGVLDRAHRRCAGCAPACASRRPRRWPCTSSTGAATSSARTATPSGRGGRPGAAGRSSGLGAPGPSAWIGGWTGCVGSCLEPVPGARPSGPRRDRGCSRGRRA